MSEKKQEFHGSDLEKVEAYYGIKKEDIIPFAGNVNPLGISPLLKKSMASHIESISEYPDRDYKALDVGLFGLQIARRSISSVSFEIRSLRSSLKSRSSLKKYSSTCPPTRSISLVYSE